MDTLHALVQSSHPLESNHIILGELKIISTPLYNSLNALELKYFNNLEIYDIGNTIYAVRGNIHSMDVAKVYESNMSNPTYARNPPLLF